MRWLAWTLMTYSSESQCAPYLNVEQSRCLRESTCDAVHAAVDGRGWLCGISLNR